MKMQNLKKNLKYRVRKINGRLLIVGDQDKCFEINDTGRLIWRYLGRDITLDEFITENFPENDFSIVKKDILDFINFLLKNDVIFDRTQ